MGGRSFGAIRIISNTSIAESESSNRTGWDTLTSIGASITTNYTSVDVKSEKEVPTGQLQVFDRKNPSKQPTHWSWPIVEVIGEKSGISHVAGQANKLMDVRPFPGGKFLLSHSCLLLSTIMLPLDPSQIPLVEFVGTQVPLNKLVGSIHSMQSLIINGPVQVLHVEAQEQHVWLLPDGPC